MKMKEERAAAHEDVNGDSEAESSEGGTGPATASRYASRVVNPIYSDGAGNVDELLSKRLRAAARSHFKKHKPTHVFISDQDSTRHRQLFEGVEVNANGKSTYLPIKQIVFKDNKVRQYAQPVSMQFFDDDRLEVPCLVFNRSNGVIRDIAFAVMYEDECIETLPLFQGYPIYDKEA